MWRALTFPAIALLVAASYLGMWWIAYGRLSRPELVARMVVAAAAVGGSSGERSERVLRQHLWDAQMLSPQGVTGDGRENVIRAAIQYWQAPPGSVDELPLLAGLNESLRKALPRLSTRNGLMGWFGEEQFRTSAGSLGSRVNGVALFRIEAADYLRYYRFFLPSNNSLSVGWGVGGLPVAYQLRPWALLAFYDPKRADLCDQIPLGLLSLLLATGFLLRLRFADCQADSRAETDVFWLWSLPRPI